MIEIDQLRAFSLFAKYSDEDLREIAVHAERLELSPRSLIYSNQTLNDYFYLIETGNIHIFDLRGTVKRIFFRLKSPYFLGEDYFFWHGHTERPDQYQTENLPILQAESTNELVFIKIPAYFLLKLWDEQANFRARIEKTLWARLDYAYQIREADRERERKYKIRLPQYQGVKHLHVRRGPGLFLRVEKVVTWRDKMRSLIHSFTTYSSHAWKLSMQKWNLIYREFSAFICSLAFYRIWQNLKSQSKWTNSSWKGKLAMMKEYYANHKISWEQIRQKFLFQKKVEEMTDYYRVKHSSKPLFSEENFTLKQKMGIIMKRSVQIFSIIIVLLFGFSFVTKASPPDSTLGRIHQVILYTFHPQWLMNDEQELRKLFVESLNHLEINAADRDLINKYLFTQDESYLQNISSQKLAQADLQKIVAHAAYLLNSCDTAKVQSVNKIIQQIEEGEGDPLDQVYALFEVMENYIWIEKQMLLAMDPSLQADLDNLNADTLKSSLNNIKAYRDYVVEFARENDLELVDYHSKFKGIEGMKYYGELQKEVAQELGFEINEQKLDLFKQINQYWQNLD